MVSRMTAYEIAGNPDDIVITHAGPDENGKYAGWITRGKGHDSKPLINSESQFNTATEAEDEMKKLVSDLKEFVSKEQQGHNNLLNILSLQETKIIGEIIGEAKKSPSN